MGEYRPVTECKWIQLARARQIADLKRAELDDTSFPYHFDSEAADQAIWFFEENLVHTKGKQFANRPFKLSAWQKWDIIAPAFGWMHKDGSRRFHRFLIYLPRKCGKSALGSGIGNYLAFGDAEPGAEVYAAATKERQARIVWGEAKRQIKRSPVLSDMVKCMQRELYCEELESIFTVLGRDSDTEDGLNVHGAIIDEYHAHKDNSMLGVLETGVEARENWQIWIISTAGFSPSSPLKDELSYCERLLEGKIENETYLPILYTVDDPERWHEPEEIIKANPMVGEIIKLDGLMSKAQQALDQPSKKPGFLVKHCNIWMTSSDPFIDQMAWEACAEKVDEKALEGQRCWGGFDYGRTEDLSAFALVFKHEVAGEEPVYDVLMRYWMPEEQDLLARSRADEADYFKWVELGLLKLTPGKETRKDIIRQDILELRSRFKIDQVGVDAWAVADLSQDLAADGLTMVSIAQTMKGMSFSTQAMRDLTIAQRLRHGGHEILQWNIANAVARYDGEGNVKLMKDLSKRRIDGAVALSMALGRAILAKDAPRVRVRTL
jgi:phage terminase large subunit-like protein